MSTRLLKHLFILIILVFSLGQLQRFQLTPTIAIYVHDILITGWLLWFAAAHYHNLKLWLKELIILLKKQPLIVVLMGWIALGMLAHLISSGFNDFIPTLYLLRTLIYISFAAGTTVVFKEPLHLRSFWTTAGLLILILGLLQYILLPDMRFLFLFGWDDHYFRLISTLFDPAFTGMILVLCFAYFYSLNLYDTKTTHNLVFLRHTYTKVICLIMIAIGVLLTYSRSSLLALGVFITIFGMFLQQSQKSKKAWWKTRIILTLLILPPILLAVYLVVPKPGGLGVNLLRTETIAARIDNTFAALNLMSLKTLFIGEGLFTRTIITINEFGLSHATVPDNLFIMLLVALGLPGLILSIYGFYILGKELYCRDKILFSAYIGLLLHTQFNNTLLQPFVLLYFLGGVSSIQSLNKPN